MKKITIAAIAVLFVLACGTAYFSQYFTGAAQRVARTQWEYLSIVSVYSVKPTQDRVNLILGVAEVCIVKPTGCGRFDVKFEHD